VLDVLSLLVDKSLVVAAVDDDQVDARYRLLETIRLYATAHLAAAGEADATRDRHRDHYLALAEDATPHLESPGQAEWTSVLALHHQNLRDALAWSHERGDSTALSRLAASLGLFWTTHGPTSEGAAWLDAALERAEDIPAQLRARVLFWRAWLAPLDFNVARVIEVAEEGMALASQLGDDALAGRFQVLVGSTSALMGGPTDVLEQGIDRARQLGDGWSRSTGLMWLMAKFISQDPPRAEALGDEAVGVARASNPSMVNISIGNLGFATWCRAICGKPAGSWMRRSARATSSMTRWRSRGPSASAPWCCCSATSRTSAWPSWTAWRLSAESPDSTCGIPGCRT
jgi:hypothetical protein